MILFCLNVLAEVLPFHNRSKMAKVRDFFFSVVFRLFWFVCLFSERTSSWAHSDVPTAIKLNPMVRLQLLFPLITKLEEGELFQNFPMLGCFQEKCHQNRLISIGLFFDRE